MRWGSMAVLIVFMAVYGTVAVDNSKPRNPGIGKTKMKRKIPVFILISVLMTLVLTTCASATELKLTASDGAAADFFGQSVSISGDYATVVSEMTAPTEGVTPAKPGGWGRHPGFTAVFAIVGLPMLVWVVVVRRRRRD